MRAKIFITSAMLACLLSVTTPAAHASAMELVCDSGKRVSVWGNQQTDPAIDLRWGGQVYRLLRIATSTGAHRFEDGNSGLVWISIPSKGMLLDAKRGEPVANECKARGAGSSGRPVR
jgi:hypothetical protein